MNKNMPLEQILAQNLTAMMARNIGLDTIDKLSSRSGVGRGTVDRVKKGEVSTKLETVEKLADAFGLPVVALLTQYDDLERIGSLVVDPATEPARAIAGSLDAVCKTADEQRLLTAYRIADKRGREAIDGAADAVLERFQRAIGNKN